MKMGLRPNDVAKEASGKGYQEHPILMKILMTRRNILASKKIVEGFCLGGYVSSKGARHLHVQRKRPRSLEQDCEWQGKVASQPRSK